ncbi:hypothetical protein SLEP1_g26208 [Rubroshorea leprosula]|uniref:Transposase (putative) gypsy type domain-containing protein n=1 Tax=Rubroshorea leprosula TaxID=152421 RepID=A0AAV5JKZ5_9ROSI|nr:hypothetical protein SLEP1_g26208 [Rubroshorea leprosula]
MSSEGAESVVGSEVMPLDYGSMDAESSPSPTSSEKTVEGVRGDEGVEVGEREVVEVGRDEVVGVRVDSIPITVVEVEGRGERNYDVNAEIVEEVKQYRSGLRTRDSLGHLVENYEISSRVLVRPAGVEERACSAPRDHWMPVYSHYLIAGLRFPLLELLIGLLLDYNMGLTQLVPNAMRAIIGFLVYCRAQGISVPTVNMFKYFFVLKGGSRRDKGWYYFTPRVAKKESRILFTAGPSSIKGWKEKFFFVDDTEWGKGDTEVRELASWKAKRANQNRFSLNEDEEEEVRKLVRKGGDVLNIMDLTSAACIEATELYGPSALSEAEMDQFLNIAGGVPIPKKPMKKSKTSTKQVDEGRARKEMVPLASAETEEEVPPLKRKGWEERRALQLEEGAEVRAPGKGNGPIPPLGPQSSMFEAKNITGDRWFINNTFPEVDQSNARQEALRYGGASVVKHVLERELGEWSSPGIQGKPEGSRTLAEAARPTLELERSSLSTTLGFEESKRKISESEREAQAQELKLTKEAFLELKGNVQTLVHNGMKEHISNFISSSSFDNIVNLYWLPTVIIAFTDCRKKVKAEYPEVDITKITFVEQEEGVEEDGESMPADFRPQIKLRWEDDANERAVFPPQFDFEFVAVEEEGAEVEEDEMEAGVEGAEVDESQPVPEVEIHPVPSDDEQPPLPDEEQPTQPPPPTE